jgi:hypothetical protein
MQVRDARQMRAAVERFTRAFEPDAVPLPEVVSLWDEIDAAERQLSAAKTLLARRVDESKAWKRAGYKSAAEFIAARSGSSTGAARTQLDVSHKVQQLPAAAQALRDGNVSGAQAAAVVHGATANPAAEHRLLRLAQHVSLKELRDEARRTRAAADPDPDATNRRIHTQRHLRTWTDPEGAWHLSGRGTTTDGSRIEAALRRLTDTQFAKARTDSRREEREAYAFDSLVELARQRHDTSTRPTPTYLTLIRVDLAALRSGEVHDEELCEIAGIGPIPVSVARELLGESILKLVITKGVDVLNVTHLGRGPNAAQRVALLWASPGCTVEGCARTRVEIDHRIPYAQTGHTRLDECDPLCKHHHNRKHRDGWALVEGTGKRPMVAPTDRRHPKSRPRSDPG